MYNRYVSQSDGSFRKSRVPDAPPRRPTPPPPPPPQHHEDAPQQAAPQCPPKKPERPSCPPPKPQRPSPPPRHQPEPVGMPLGGFLRQLLPQNFDTGDLVVVLLILLIAGDCPEDRSTALLTLVLYLFM